MTIDIDATYRDGAIHPEVPLNLPNNTPVRVHVEPKAAPISTSRDESLARRPKAPRITQEEFRARIAKHAIKAPPLPPDFSREDIYSDHD
jgi:hypothetical protein